MNQYPLWRYLLVLTIVIVSTLYALPNLFGTDPALQISARRSAPINDAVLKQVVDALNTAKVPLKASEHSINRILVRFPTDAARTQGLTVVNQTLDAKLYLVAFNLAPATPHWLRVIGAKPMFMGLDLRGGVHFLLQVDTDAVQKQTEERFVSELRTAFREGKLRFRTVSRAAGGGVEVKFLNDEAKVKGRDLLTKDFPDLIPTESGVAEDFALTLKLKSQYVSDTRKTAIKQNLTTLRNRINEFGVAEP